MKIKTVPALVGKEMVIWDGTIIKFDNKGFAEVNDSKGKQILEKYPSMVFAEDFQEEQEKTPKEKFTEGYAEQLKRELDLSKGIIKDREDTIESLKADKEEWANKAAELQKAKDAAEEQLVREKETFEKQVKLYEFKIELVTSTNENLRTLCDKSGFPKEEWEKLNKEKLVEYILNKS